MKRDELRKVEFYVCTELEKDPWDGSSFENRIGYFHQWLNNKSGEIVAIVEDEMGDIWTIGTKGIRFIQGEE